MIAGLAIREFDECLLLSLPSPYWTIQGLTDDGWYALYFYDSEQAARRDLPRVLDDDGRAHQQYDDFIVLAPEVQHELPKGRNQAADWLRSQAPATAAERRKKATEGEPQRTRGSVSRRSKRS